MTYGTQNLYFKLHVKVLQAIPCFFRHSATLEGLLSACGHTGS